MPISQAAAPHLILASASPRRRVALTYLGLTADIRPIDLDETPSPGERPVATACRLAIEKARAAAQPGRWVLAADTLVIGPDGRALGKPASPEDARTTLTRLRGRSHQVVTAQALLVDRELRSDHLSTLVTMRRYGDEEIDNYIAGGDPLDKAGSYAIQHPTFRPVRALSGCYLNVVGLPLCRTTRLLREAGWPASQPALRPPWCVLCRRAAGGGLPGL